MDEVESGPTRTGGFAPFLGIPPGVVLRGPTGVRSVYHQLAKRTKGHLFVSVLAYYLLSAIEATMERNGNHSLFSIKETLSTHQRATMRVATDNDVVYSIGSSGTPEPKHKEIYQTLGVGDCRP